MSTFRPLFAAGDRAIFEGRFVTIAEISGSRAIVKDELTGQHAARPTNKLDPVPPAPSHDPPPDLDLIPDAMWNQAAALAAEFKRIVEEGCAIDAQLRQLESSLGLKRRRLYQLLAVYKANPSVSALLPRRAGRKPGSRVLAAEIETLIAKTLSEHYFTSERPSIASAVEIIAAKARACGLHPPCRSAVAARVGCLTDTRPNRRRLGPKLASLLDGAPGTIEVSRPLERVEIDHTLVDVILIAEGEERQVLGRMFLTVAIDCFTRMIIGYHLSWSAPSATSVALCLLHAAQDKRDFLDRHGIRVHWPTAGFIESIWVDNAREFHSVALVRGCAENSIELNYRPVATPRYGGTIERLIGTLMGHCHLLPGTTFSNVIQKGDYRSEARAVMTEMQFRVWFAEQVASQYHLRVHRTLGLPPLVAWQIAEAKSPIKQLLDLHRYAVAFLPQEQRLLGRTGIRLHNLDYWSESFHAWVSRKPTVRVHYNPSDVTSVVVRLPDGTDVTARSRIDTPTSLTSLRAREEARRQRARDPRLVQERDAGLLRNLARVEQASASVTPKRKAAAPIVAVVDTIDLPSIAPQITERYEVSYV